MAFQPWKVIVELDGRRIAKSFNVAMAFQPWKANRLRGGRCLAPSRFNVAMAFQPWKARGPYKPPSTAGGFNVAMAFQPWKAAQSVGLFGGIAALQCGHGFSAMESRARRPAVYRIVV